MDSKKLNRHYVHRYGETFGQTVYFFKFLIMNGFRMKIKKSFRARARTRARARKNAKGKVCYFGKLFTFDAH